MRWLACTLCDRRMQHGFPMRFGNERHLLCGDCMRDWTEGKLPRFPRRRKR